jgi:hypothetical protein
MDFWLLQSQQGYMQGLPLPWIGDILSWCSRHQFLAKIDLSLFDYTFELDKGSSEKCVIATPFRLYWYLHLPMGINQGPNEGQELIEEAFCEI